MRSTEETLVLIVRSRRFRQWLWAIFLFLLVTVIVRSSVIDVDVVPSASMAPTIPTDAHIWINHLAFALQLPLIHWHLVDWSSPRRGEVIVFRSPQDGLLLVKRAVAVAGDQVEMIGERLIVNGVPLGYRRLEANAWRESADWGSWCIDAAIGDESNRAAPPATFGPLMVPPGMVFVLGDNRDVAVDSRMFGCVPLRSITGRAVGY